MSAEQTSPDETHPGETAEHAIDDESGTVAIYDPDQAKTTTTVWIRADESSAIDKEDWR